MGIDEKSFVDSPATIYGLDHECRALCSQRSEYLPTRFFVGTQTLKSDDNQVHMLECVEESNHLSKVAFRHKLGEIWHLLTFSKQPQYLLTSYSALGDKEAKLKNYFTIWEMGIDLSQPLHENENSTLLDLKPLYEFDDKMFDENLGRMARLKPENEDEIMLALETKLACVDLEKKSLITYITADQQNGQKGSNRLSKILTFNWSPHFSSNIVSIVCNNNIYAKDLRTTSNAWHISQAHSQVVRDMDFNSNSQYYIATCGDDCEVKFWDIRDTSRPVLSMLHHSHWVWAVRYNLFHDHLVLSSSSDGNVNLLRTSSIVSQPYGKLIDNELLDEEDSSLKRLLISEQKSDGLIRTFEDHVESVYAIEWSLNDPWIFASLSYDGRLIINKVPEEEKMNILG